MIEFANKKNVKVVSLAIAAIFVIGAFACLLYTSDAADEL